MAGMGGFPMMAPSSVGGLAVDLQAQTGYGSVPMQSSFAGGQFRLQPPGAGPGRPSNNTGSLADQLVENVKQQKEREKGERLTIKPKVEDDSLWEEQTNDFALPLVGTSNAATSRTNDGYPLNDVVLDVSKPMKRGGIKREKRKPLNLAGPVERPVYLQYSSCFIFSTTSMFRRIVFLVAFDKRFEGTILVLIAFSSIALALDKPSLEEGSTLKQGLGLMDVAFNVVFFIEFVVKVITMGFCLHPGSYLRNSWNQLDFFIVLTSFASYIFNDPRLTIVRSFRLLRALRPLRMISRLRGMQLVVMTLIRAIPHIINVVVFGLFEFVIFGILGVQLYGGKFYRCTDDHINDRHMCYGNFIAPDGSYQRRLWVNSVFNFDNIFEAIQSLFVVATMDNWMALAYNGMDATDVDQQPRTNKDPMQFFFFMGFVVLGSFFWVNLLVGVIIDHYSRIQAESGDMIFSTESQKQWSEALKIKKYQNQELAKGDIPRFIIRKYLFILVHNKSFEIFIMSCICLNIIVMAMEHDDQSPFYTTLQVVANQAFTFIFLFEFFAKVVALFPKRYWQDSWNRFDFIIVMGSLPPLFGVEVGVGSTVFRIFRIGRMFKLVQSAKGLRALFNTFVMSLPAIANVGSLLFLLMFVYSVLGMNMFADLPRGQYLNDSVNFDDFGQGLILLFRVFTGDSWSNLLMDAIDCGQLDGYALSTKFNPVAFFYFISFILIGSFVMLNLVIAVILDKFIDSAESEGLLSTNSFFDALQRKMLLDGFIAKLRLKLDEYQARRGGGQAFKGR